MLNMLQLEERLLILVIKTKIVQLDVSPPNYADKVKEIEQDFAELARLDKYMTYVMGELQEYVDNLLAYYTLVNCL